MNPAELTYLKTHEWFHLADGVATVGVSDFAQHQLNDVVFVDLPAVGRKVSRGEAVCVLESCKAAADVYSPVSGTITAVNDALTKAPENVNKGPYGDGWLFKVKVEGFDANAPEYLKKDAYDKLCEA